MTQGTWIALTVLALFAMNVIAQGDLPKYKAVLLGSGQSTATPSPEGSSPSTTILGEQLNPGGIFDSGPGQSTYNTPHY